MLARSLRSCWLLTGLAPLNCPPLGLQYWGHRAGEVSAVMLLCDPGKPVTSGSFHWMKRGEFSFAKLDRVAETACCEKGSRPGSLSSDRDRRETTLGGSAAPQAARLRMRRPRADVLRNHFALAECREFPLGLTSGEVHSPQPDGGPEPGGGRMVTDRA